MGQKRGSYQAVDSAERNDAQEVSARYEADAAIREGGLLNTMGHTTATKRCSITSGWKIRFMRPTCCG
jgi:hypothetical protein